jgi:NADH dehydrogenase
MELKPLLKQAQVVVVGAGFAGINAVKTLSKNKNINITLIDRRNYHLFQPLLYQVATAGLSPADIATPIRSVFSGYSNVTVYLGNVSTVDLQNKIVNVEQDTVRYDYLILACGAKHSYFGHNEWEEFSPGLKTLEQATEIRRRILLSFEEAEKESSIEKQKQLLTFVIVGGGPTGVELAGAIAEISRYTLEKDFRNIDPARTRVILIEAGPRILAGFSEKLSRRAARDLEQLGVQIWTSSRVSKVNLDNVQLGDETIYAKTILWAAGVLPSSLGKTLGTPLDPQGRVIVEKDLSLPNHPDVFVLGDQAHFDDEKGNPLPGLAPVAIQQGKHAAKNILRKLHNQESLDFEYADKGLMATIGRKRAVVETKKLQFGGFFAWVAWLFIHIYYLIGFRNRFIVFFQWTWSYITLKRGARLIVNKDWRSTK